MVALTKNRMTPAYVPGELTMVDPVAAAANIFEGALTAIDAAGNVAPATAASAKVRGVAEYAGNNSSGAAGDVSVSSKKGVFKFHQTGLTRADLETDVNVIDDQTVGGAGPCVAGKLVQLEGDFAWVEIQ